MSGAEPEDPFVAEARRLAAIFAAGAAHRDRERVLPVEELAAVKRSGLHALRVPREYGGADAGFVTVVDVFVALSRADSNIAQAIQSQGAIVEILRAAAPPALKGRAFDLLLSGSLITNAVAERGGRVLGEIATRIALNASGGGVIDGIKYYATGSAFAEFLYVTALDPEGRTVAAIVPVNRRGVEITDDWNGFGQRTTASGTVALNGVAVAASELFAPPGPDARRSHLQTSAQILHAAIDAGIAEAALDDALTLCRERGKPLREANLTGATADPYALAAIGDISARAAAAVALTRAAASKLDRAADAFYSGHAADAVLLEAAVSVAQARLVAAEASLHNSERLFEVANASGSDRSLGLDRHWRNARTHVTHDPLSYKQKFIGDYLLNGRPPPTSVKF